MLDEILSEVDRSGTGTVSRLLHPVVVPCDRLVDPPESPQRRRDLAHRVEERLLVLLEVTVVRERQSLQRHQEPGEIANEAAGLAPGEFSHVGVLLLREHRTASGVGVVERAEPEFLTRPQDELFAHAR